MFTIGLTNGRIANAANPRRREGRRAADQLAAKQ
jgi:hypothetical protein